MVHLLCRLASAAALGTVALAEQPDATVTPSMRGAFSGKGGSRNASSTNTNGSWLAEKGNVGGSVNLTDPTRSKSASSLLAAAQSPACVDNPSCVPLGLAGDCCPSAKGAHLECCGQQTSWPGKEVMQDYEQHEHVNCYDGHGGVSIPPEHGYRPGLSSLECGRVCDGNANCSGFVYFWLQRKCYLLSFVTLPECEVGSYGQDNYLFETFVKSARHPAPKQQSGQKCGADGSSGYFYGDCADGLACTAPPPDSGLGASKTCKNPSHQAGDRCGADGSTGDFHGDCATGLVCTLPPPGSGLGAFKTCQTAGLTQGQHCGSFSESGDVVSTNCASGLSCACRALTPCRPWAGECYVSCC